MILLALDVESTGLIQDRKVSTSEFEKYPRLVEVAFFLIDTDTREILEKECYVIEPNGWEIPDEAIAIHGISTEDALTRGIDLKVVLEKMKVMHDKAAALLAWNGTYDAKLIRAGCCSVGMEPDLTKIPLIDPMHLSRSHFNIPNQPKDGNPARKGSKLPKLTEAYELSFGEAMTGAHSAGADVQGMVDVFFDLLDQGVITDEHFKKAFAKNAEIKEKVAAKELAKHK